MIGSYLNAQIEDILKKAIVRTHNGVLCHWEKVRLISKLRSDFQDIMVRLKGKTTNPVCYLLYKRKGKSHLHLVLSKIATPKLDWKPTRQK